MIRGIERRRIFNDDKDRENFIDRMSILLPETGTTCYAWAFMLNHAHFIFRSGHSGIPTLYRLDRKYILGKGRQKDRVEARDLVCYWASNELGVSITDLAKTFGMTAAGASYAVRRGETIAVENKWQLSD